MTGDPRPLAVVTGASSGVGLELAELFAAAGYDLIVTAEDDGIHDVRRAIAATGATVASAQVNLARGGGPEELYARIRTHKAPLEAVALNAAAGREESFGAAALDDALALVDRNVRATVHLAKHVVRDMAAAGRGRILFTSPRVASDRPVEAAAASFVHAFAEALRTELAGSGVSVAAAGADDAQAAFDALMAGE